MSQFRFTRPNRFPPVIKNLIIINVLVFIAQVTFGAKTPFIENLFALHDIRSVFFKPHQLLTHMFLHGSLGHLLFNMLALDVWQFIGKLLGCKKISSILPNQRVGCWSLAFMSLY